MANEKEQSTVVVPRSTSSPTEIRITAVNRKIHAELKNIAKHYGVTLTDYMRMKLPGIIDSEPDRYKEPYNE